MRHACIVRLGSVKVAGTELGQLSQAALDRFRGQQIGIIFQKAHFVNALTVEENLKVGAHMKKYGKSIKDGLNMVYHYFPRLKEKRNETAGFISGGEQQMTVVGRALMTRPKLILLDEPSMGLAPLLIHEIFNIIVQLNKEEKISILLVEQNAKLALNVAPHAYVMENGRIVMDDSADKLIENPDIKDFYLGMTDFGGRKSFRDVKHYKRRKRWLT